MSHIFDALLKSETDRNGKNSALSTSLTEVLRQAERRAAADRKPRVTATVAASTLPEDEIAHEADLGIVIGEAPELLPQHPLASSFEAVEEPPSFFDRIRSIPVVLPAENRLVAHTESDSAAAEAFQLMGVRLRHIRKDRPLKKVLITSTVPEEGKSMVSANLACTLAAGNSNKVLLLEADVRRPSLSQQFELSHYAGLCEWLAGASSLEQSIYRLDSLSFWILPAGNVRGNPLELIQSPRLSLALEELQTRFDWIIIDTPPVLPLADTSVLAKLSDGVLLVTRRGVTQKAQMQRGIEALDKGKLLGAVINSSRKSHHDYYYYGYGASSGANSPSRLSSL